MSHLQLVSERFDDELGYTTIHGNYTLDDAKIASAPRYVGQLPWMGNIMSSSQYTKLKNTDVSKLRSLKFRKLTEKARYMLKKYIEISEQRAENQAVRKKILIKDTGPSLKLIQGEISGDTPGMRQIRKNQEAAKRRNNRTASERQGKNDRTNRNISWRPQ